MGKYEYLVPRSVLLRAVKTIKDWHDINEPNPNPIVFKLYYENSPEMKEIRKVLGEYDEMKDEVIEATSTETNEQLVCGTCNGEGEYLNRHPENYGIVKCKCKNKGTKENTEVTC